MNVLYEEDGAFKAATVLEDHNTSLQVQTQHGKRAKIKSVAVLLRFEHPSLNDFMREAQAIAASLDPDFLWEVCAQQEFSFDTLGREYFGRAPRPEEAAGLLMRLHATPTHFYRKGKGHYKPAPPEALKAALASIERKRRQAQLQAEYEAQLRRFELPASFRPLLPQLLYKPDRNAIETRALEAVCGELKLSVPRLLERCGALPSTHDYHLGRFLFEHFPSGTGFAPGLAAEVPTGLPDAGVEAFSIDDATTTEIDDAFSVRALSNGHWEIGIHIAAPALGIAPGSALDAEAARRLSTVYFPGDKITMLPPPVIEQFTLSEGRECPALSMYLEVTPELALAGTRTRIERVHIARNLRHDLLDQVFDEAAVSTGRVASPYGEALLVLYRLALGLEKARGRADSTAQRVEYSFHIDNDRVRIVPRRRGSPIDKVVSELMILVNSTWARQLSEADVAALYRVQSNGKVRMSTVPAAHQGLGVEQYVWASSPIRRYTDLINQRQLLAWARGEPPVYGKGDERLLVILRDFESAYEAYAEFQRQMERYWCLRWLLQEQVTVATAQVVREDLVCLECIPLYCRSASLPALAPGTRVEVTLSRVDLIELSVHCEFRATPAPQHADTAAAAP
ncbi:MAG TPA: RNB domain-containing ribonuclease [Burkholderiales bacterium]|jgi:exoribonuclease-2|nr:RNB domain-containing ribonuclease [Burkholderiales bacterium]